MTDASPVLAPPRLPPEAKNWLWIEDNARALGIHLTGSKGSGKSRLLGRRIAFFDAYRHVPTLVIDPTGEVIRNLIDRILWMERPIQDDMLARIRYVDIGHPNRTATMPLYYRLGDEPLNTIANRYLNLIRRLDINLQSAPIQGWNRVQRVGRALGMILAALDLQITEAELLLTHPEAFAARLNEALARNPRELADPVRYYREALLPLPLKERLQEADAYLSKVSVITWDPALTALFGADTATLDWRALHDEELIYLIDFSHLEDDETKRLVLTWLVRSFLAAIRHMGKTRPKPISVIIDELTYLLSDPSIAADLLTNDLIELIDVLSRNFKLWLTLAHQEMYQVNERVGGSLMTLGTQVLGRTTDMETAKRLAEQYYPTDFYKLKKTEPHYMGDGTGGYFRTHETTVEFTTDEQIEQNARRFMTLPTFTFMVGAAVREGSPATALRRASIARLDEGQFVNAPLVDQVLQALLEHYSPRTADVQQAIAERQEALATLPRSAAPSTPAAVRTRRRSEA
jgi:hypothetical protein